MHSTSTDISKSNNIKQYANTCSISLYNGHYAKVIITDEEIKMIETESQNTDKIDRNYHMNLIDEAANTYTSGEKTSHIRN